MCDTCECAVDFSCAVGASGHAADHEGCAERFPEEFDAGIDLIEGDFWEALVLEVDLFEEGCDLSSFDVFFVAEREVVCFALVESFGCVDVVGVDVVMLAHAFNPSEGLWRGLM